MKKLLLLLAAVACCGLIAGCVSPNWIRLIPENKDADIAITTIYGNFILHTRVNPGGTNGLGPITTTTVPANSVILSR